VRVPEGRREMDVFSINEIRLPEELKYVDLLKSHPMAKQVKKKIPEVITRGKRRLDLLTKGGVKIIKSIRPDIRIGTGHL